MEKSNNEKYNKLRKEKEISFIKDLINELERFFETSDEKEKTKIVEELST